MCKKTAFFGSFKKKPENYYVQKNRSLWYFLRKTGKILLAKKKTVKLFWGKKMTPFCS